MKSSRAAPLTLLAFISCAPAAAAPAFRPPLRVALPADFRAGAVLAGDFDGDGRKDLAVLGERGALLVLSGDGRGGFRALPPVPAGANPTAMAVADLNGDGRPDVVVANHETDYVTVLLGDGRGGFSASRRTLHTKPHPHAVAVGDFDRDGKPDIAVDSWGEDRITLLFGKDGWRGPGTPLAIGTRPYYTLAAADVDGDGNLDLVTPNWGKGTVSILLGDGKGGFAHAPGSPFPAGPTPFAAAVADLNGDGRPDVVVANYSGHASDTRNDGLTWIRNDGGRKFTPFPERVAKGDYSARVAAGDVNGDGFADVAFSNANGRSVTVVFGSPEGPRGSEDVTTMASPHAVLLADLDGDGRADLVVAGEGSDELLVFLATPAPAARAAEAAIPGVSIRKIERREPVPLVLHLATVELAKSGPAVVASNRLPDGGGFAAATVRDLASRHGLSLAVNASFFEVPRGRYPEAGDRVNAVGALLIDGKRVAAKGRIGGLLDGALCLGERRAWVEKGFACAGARWGVGTGPVLLLGNERTDTAFADKIFKSLRHPRTAAGVDARGTTLWLLVADGRQPGISEGATLDELKDILKEAGATDAINLDGGGSSTLVQRQPDGTYKVLNVPIHDRIPGRERPVVSAVGVGRP